MVQQWRSPLLKLRPLSTQGPPSLEVPKLILWLFTVLFRDLLARTRMDTFSFVCNSPSFHLFTSSLICCRSACDTSVEVSVSFGGRSWPISAANIIADQVPNSNKCQGSFFVLDLDATQDDSNPTWVFGDSFMVRNLLGCTLCSSYLVLFSRKMCTACSVTVHPLLDLLSCLLRLADQVR